MKTLSRKIMAFAFMLLSVTISAYADTWTDPSTSITWTFTVLDDGTVAIGGGTKTTPAVPTSTEGELTVPAQINELDVTSVMSYAFYNCKKITSLTFDSQSITLQANASYIFGNCSNLSDINFLRDWNVNNVTNLTNTFYNCSNIPSLEPLSNWNTSKVTNLSNTFNGCKNLTSLEGLENWNTGKVTNLSYTFDNIGKLTSIEPLRNWTVNNVTNMSYLLYLDYNITSLEPLSNWNTSKVTNLAGAFGGNLETLEGLENWNTSRVTNLEETFSCVDVKSLGKIRNWNVGNVTNMKMCFYGCRSLTSLEGLENWNTGKVTNLSWTFAGCNNLTSIEALRNWNTGKVTDMSYTFGMYLNSGGCRKLTSLEPLSGWNVGNVTNMTGTFEDCSSLTSLEGLENWNTSKVRYLTTTFEGCKSLTSIEALRNWNTGNVENMLGLFRPTLGAQNEYMNLTSIEPLSNWNTGKVTNMGSMFQNCDKLTSIEPMAEWDVSKVTTMEKMFYNCKSLSSIEPLKNWNVGNVTKMTQMFYNCSNLGSFEIEDWDVGKVTSMASMFYNCKNIVYVNISRWNWNVNNKPNAMFNGCIKLERCYLPKKNLLSIPMNFFQNCNLKEITLPSCVESIGDNAFYDCGPLTEITIPAKVNSIGSYAFNQNDGVLDVYCMANTPPTLKANSFGLYYQNGYSTSTSPILRNLYVKESALENYQNDSQWKRFQTITDMIPVIIGSGKKYATLSLDYDADFSQTEGVQPYIANKYLEGEDAWDYIEGFETKKRMSPAMKKATDSGNNDIKLIVLARYPNGYVPSRTGDDNFDFHGIILYGKPGTYYYKMGEQDFASDNQNTVTWNTNYMKSAYESWQLNPVFDHDPINWMEYPKDDTYNFVLKNNVFKYIDNAGTINRHKSWLELPAEKVSGTYFEAGAKMISTFDPNDSDSFATGLSFIVEDEPAEIQNRYNLNGQKVDANYKGVVIVNGKKLYNK